MAKERNPTIVKLNYRIASCTDYSGKYVPEHILVDIPTDQASRWSGAAQTGNARQWIILELRQPSVVQSITFGKFHKAHPCNMKEFEVYIGRSLDTMTLALRAGLNNDHIPETFNLTRPNEAGLQRASRYIKIVPLSAHSPSFHTSIWHVALKGINDQDFVKDADEAFASYKETSTVRHVMKYLRQRRHLSAFNAVQSRTGVLLEHPLVTKIYDSLMSGDWPYLESLIQAAAEDALFDGYIDACDPKALWSRLNGANSDGDVPSPRAGHQLCIDSEAGLIYLFGGWDGEKNLDDLWVYSIPEARWKMLSASTALDGGPGARSCHSMVFDPLLGYIYLMGRLVEGDGQRSPSPSNTVTPAQPQGDSALSAASVAGSAPRVVTNPPAAESVSRSLPSDFYRYTTRGPNTGKWTVLSEDTAVEDGPPLLHDHQMEIDAEKQILYVFGGLVLNGELESGTVKCAGLYRYHIATGKWEHVMDDTGPSTSRTIPSRYGHAMVFDPRSQRIFILAGKKNDYYLADIYTYDTNSQEVIEVTSDFSTSGPDPCFCPRVVIDPKSGHMYLLPGLMRPRGQKKSSSSGTLRSQFWIYKPESMRWTNVVNARVQAPDIDWDELEDELQPQPRYAHQIVYDSSRKEFFVHGGNSGHDDGKTRLDDFWSMKFERPSRGEMTRRATFIVRRQRFKELCETVPPVQALTYLQREVHAVVDHLSTDETATFRALHSHLFDSAAPSCTTVDGDIEMSGESSSGKTLELRKSMPPIPELKKDDTEGEMNPALNPERFRQRTQVFESLLELINIEAKQPVTDLVDLIGGQLDGL